MANVLVDETALQDIADAIRAKNGTQNTYKPGQMADAIEAIPSGGITPTGTVNINSNGTHDVTQYASANVNVPTGITPTGTKQISITQNGTVTEDVTNYASAEITVNVPTGGGGATLISSETVSGQQGKQINVNASWFDTYDLVVIIPNITLSAQDWLYVIKDATTGGYYTDKNTSFDERYKTILSKSASTAINYLFNGDRNNSYGVSGAVSSYLYYYAYTSGVTMTGTFDIYGISL